MVLGVGHEASMASVTRPPPHNRNDFEIAIPCVLEAEFDALQTLSFEFRDDDVKYHKAQTDPDTYSTERIGKRDVTAACMPGMGKVNSTNTASDLPSNFHGT
jgi:hypothetical protein